jgi:hypothetical protein
MKQNVGKAERIIRIVLGVIILVIYPWIGWWALIGIIPLVTGIVGYCPLYGLLKISTRK